MSYILGAPDSVNRSFVELFPRRRPARHAADRQEQLTSGGEVQPRTSWRTAWEERVLRSPFARPAGATFTTSGTRTVMSSWNSDADDEVDLGREARDQEQHRGGREMVGGGEDAIAVWNDGVGQRSVAWRRRAPRSPRADRGDSHPGPHRLTALSSPSHTTVGVDVRVRPENPTLAIGVNQGEPPPAAHARHRSESREIAGM